MIYFYGRVSSKDQNLARQLEVAKAYKNIDHVYCDKQSGKDFDRHEYQALKSVVAPTWNALSGMLSSCTVAAMMGSVVS